MARGTHESRFTYNLSKPYPFRWFTPVAVVGLLILAALFSFLNYVTSGFYLVNVNNSNPNETTQGIHWMTRLPSYFRANSEAICQPVTIPVGSTIFTNQTALTYTLTSVWLAYEPNDIKTFSPSLSYYNNVLERCDIWSIEIDFSNFVNTQPNQIAFTAWNLVVTAFVTCSIYGPRGLQYFNLTQAYNHVPESVPMFAFRNGTIGFLGTNFISRDRQTRASLWWGETLLSLRWLMHTFNVADVVKTDEKAGRESILKGGLAYAPRHPPEEGDFTDLDFFKVDYRVSFAPKSLTIGPRTVWPSAVNTTYQDALYTSRLNASAIYPNIWVTGDMLGKAAWSTVLVDLGQADVGPNVLINDTLLAKWTSGVGIPLVGGNTDNPEPGPATQRYRAPGYETGPLHISSSTISAEYLCQVPKRKPLGNLIITILVADLVLLQSAWQIYKLVVDTFFLPKQKSDSSLSPSESRTALLPRHSSPHNGFGQDRGSLGEELRLLTPSLHSRVGYERQHSSNS